MMNDLLTAFGLVFLAELPDKTMFAALLLATRFPRRSAVWAGVTAAYSAHVVLAVTLGGLLARLPDEPLGYAVAALFVVAGGYLVWDSLRTKEAQDTGNADTFARSWGATFGAAAATIGVAEFADITQIATASLAATRDSVLAVGIGATLALASVSGLTVAVGSALVRRVRLALIQRAAGVLFVVIGVATLV
nr:TMEM165/GDT1 family protein [Acidobacteriota bacterium]